MKRYINLLYGLLILGVSILVVDIVVTVARWNSLTGSVEYTYSPRETEEEVQVPSYAFYSVIPRRNLFNSSSPAPKEVKKVVKPPPPKITSRLILKGTISGKEEFSRAIIEDLTTRKEDLYEVGDTVGGAKIIKIERNKVVLKRGDGEETLYAFNEATPSLPSVRTIKTPPERVVSKKLAQRIIENPESILREARIVPYVKEGRMSGLRVDNIKKGSIMELMGVKSGDIIKEINGEVLDSPEKIFRLYEELQQATRVTATIERGGRRETLTYVIR